MTTVYSFFDGALPVKPFEYVLGEDWSYLYSDTWKGADYNVYKCMNGECVAVIEV